ncbi:MAG: ABC transporter permease [Chloroflexota bacterium]|nr:ABC transporter permease [Chloroflexia bacterium]MDQ3167171.1 ABC transporter permease [Chloroflexota bacterium]MDQ3512725.1 ABC transporter permease [Chloroflexota bacterium]
MGTTTALDQPGPQRGGGVRSLLANPASLSDFGPLLALILAGVYFTTQSDRFLSGANLSLVVQQSMVVGVLAIGQTLIILTAGIDLSCGAVMALGNIVMTREAAEAGLNPYLAIVLGLGACTVFGLLNGLLITRINLPPFIVTLGTLNIAFALTHIYSRERTVTNVPDEHLYFGNVFRIGDTRITYGMVVMFALFLLFWFILSQTTLGRHIYAVGNNPEATRLTGINTGRLLLIVYTVAGFLYGIAAMLLVARTGVGDPNAGQTDNLSSITAVVLGGTSLFGGRGAILGTLVGVLIVGVIRNGLQLIGVGAVYQILVTGILVIVAVAVDQLSRRGRR